MDRVSTYCHQCMLAQSRVNRRNAAFGMELLWDDGLTLPCIIVGYGKTMEARFICIRFCNG